MTDGCARRRQARLLLGLVLYTAGSALMVLVGLGWEVLGPPSGAAGIVPILMMIVCSAGAAAGMTMIAVLRCSSARRR